MSAIPVKIRGVFESSLVNGFGRARLGRAVRGRRIRGFQPLRENNAGPVNSLRDVLLDIIGVPATTEFIPKYRRYYWAIVLLQSVCCHELSDHSENTATEENGEEQ